MIKEHQIAVGIDNIDNSSTVRGWHRYELSPADFWRYAVIGVTPQRTVASRFSNMGGPASAMPVGSYRGTGHLLSRPPLSDVPRGALHRSPIELLHGDRRLHKLAIVCRALPRASWRKEQQVGPTKGEQRHDQNDGELASPAIFYRLLLHSVVSFYLSITVKVIVLGALAGRSGAETKK